MTAHVLSISLPLFAAGALLLHLSLRTAGPVERRTKWIKYLTYISIVHVVFAAILLGRLYLLVLVVLIVISGAVELWCAVARARRRAVLPTMAATLYSLAAGALVVGALRVPQGFFIYLYLVTAGFDGFSEVLGRLFGRIKLARRLSPGKTLEGVVGGAAGAVVISLFAAPFANFNSARAGMLGVAIAAAALLGDMAASYVKRRAAIKDYSALLPAHGGILDRFDSLLGTATLIGPLFWQNS